MPFPNHHQKGNKKKEDLSSSIATTERHATNRDKRIIASKEEEGVHGTPDRIA